MAIEQPTEKMYVIERLVKQIVLVSASAPLDAKAKSRTLPEHQWVTSGPPQDMIMEVYQTNQLNYYLRRDQPHLCICWDEQYIAQGEANYDACIWGTNSLKPTYHEAYVPYDLIMYYGMNDAFRLIAHADPIHVAYYKSKYYYTHDGEHYEGELPDFLLDPDELSDHVPNH